MESLPDLPLLKFNKNTLQEVRKEINLDTPERLEEALNLLDDWVQKQSHFMKKDFSRDYLERILITTKGLIERAKVRLDRYCTFRTTMPEFFIHDDIKETYLLQSFVIQAHLPKMTKEHYRIHITKINSSEGELSLFQYYKYILLLSEYFKIHEYTTGFVAIFDLSDTSIMKIMSQFNLVEFRQFMTISIEAFGMRLKGIHYVTSSKMIDSFISLLKTVLTEKLGKRIHVHKNWDTICEFVDIDCLPIEYGGKERSLKELQDDWFKTISSSEFQNYLKELDRAKVDESYRQTDKFNEDYIGMPGSFRTLVVD